MLVDYAGNVVLEAGSEETMLSFELDLKSMHHYRKAFPFCRCCPKILHQASGTFVAATDKIDLGI